MSASVHWGNYEVRWESHCIRTNQFYDNSISARKYADFLAANSNILNVSIVTHDGPHNRTPSTTEIIK